ncbi:TRAP transporter small permease protein [Marinobacter lutaoensis]|uniref:TRAP transporter small permease protein n=1 Tax=Marinobacter lutaoensis TaxID=135739 RepID=A0A1V2DUY2_9GAMM|nr:TRAP transporter small permease [Marinobacter lutaoensis]ONF44534.1 TRAP transporter small permease protein [Marinobacter lutaoensis]
MLQQVNRVLDRLLVGVDRGSLWLARAGGVMILLTVVLVTLEVLSRQFLGRSGLHSTELTGYVMAISSSWAFAYTLVRKAHIRIDALYLNLPGATRVVLDLLALLAQALFCVLVVGAALEVAEAAYSADAHANTPLATPLWIPQSLWVLGLLWFSIAVVLMTVRVLTGLLSWRLDEVQAVAGSLTLDEQIREESKDTD